MPNQSEQEQIEQEQQEKQQLNLIKEYLDGIHDPEETSELHGDALDRFIGWLHQYYTIKEKT